MSFLPAAERDLEEGRKLSARWMSQSQEVFVPDCTVVSRDQNRHSRADPTWTPWS